METTSTLHMLLDVLAMQGATNRREVLNALERAGQRAGLEDRAWLDDHDVDALLAELAAEGGRIQEAAERIASWRARPGDAA